MVIYGCWGQNTDRGEKQEHSMLLLLLQTMSADVLIFLIAFLGKYCLLPEHKESTEATISRLLFFSLENLSLMRRASEAVFPPQNASQVKNMNKWEVRELILHCISYSHAVELGSSGWHTETSSPKAFGIRHCCPVSWVMDRHIKLTQSVGSSSLESVLTCHSGQHKLQVLRKAPFHERK